MRAHVCVCVWFVFKLLTECVGLVSQRGLTACLFVKLVKTRYGAFVVLPYAAAVAAFYFHYVRKNSVDLSITSCGCGQYFISKGIYSLQGTHISLHFSVT